jgi:hypothetical protein
MLRREKVQLVFPIQTSRRDHRVRSPIEGDVVENVVSREVLGLPVKDACDECVTACVVMDQFAGQG